MSAFVDFQNVWLAYNDALWAQGQFAVEDLNLQIDEGEFVAIVGPSGCGKSTFMKLTTGLKQPTKGHITIGGQPVTGPLKITGMAFQAPSLLPWRTTLDNVLSRWRSSSRIAPNFAASGPNTPSAPAPCCARWAWAAMRASTPGSCRAA